MIHTAEHIKYTRLIHSYLLRPSLPKPFFGILLRGCSYSTASLRDDWPTHASPTPYDILNCRKGSSNYSREYYCELVKRYHPDLAPKGKVDADAPWFRLPADVRAERFRLVILAKKILSDPDKKATYDALGIGWVGQNENIAVNVYGGKEGYGTGGRYDCSRCATWEDWEEFRARRDSPHEPQKEFIANWKFASLAVFFALVGCGWNLTYATSSAKEVADHYDRVTARIRRDVRGRRDQAINIASDEGRLLVYERLRGPGYLSNMCGGPGSRMPEPRSPPSAMDNDARYES